MDLAKLRAFWAHRQGLDGSLNGASPAVALERAGWARSVGGCSPYLALHARTGASRQAVDGAVARAEIHELPAARGCTYVCPASDYALALATGEPSLAAERQTAAKLGVTQAEIDGLANRVLAALRTGPMQPDEIKAATGDAVRNLGEEGRKKGLTTTLPLALAALQASGEIRRVPVNGRLDQQRYRYTLWSPNPRGAQQPNATALARRYFAWAAPASLAEFQRFSGLGVKASKEALAPLELIPVEAGAERFWSHADASEFAAFRTPSEPHYALIGSIDSLLLLRTGVGELLDHDVPAFKGLTDLPHHAIVDRGRIIGMWEYDAERAEIVWAAFTKPTAELRAKVAHVEAFVSNELGDARAFSLDSPAKRTARLNALRQLT